jgi:titin
MKKVVTLSLVFAMSLGLFFSPNVNAITTDAPVPLNYCAGSSGQTVYVQWEYSCPSLYSCSIEIEEYIGGTWTNIATVSATSSPKTFSGQSYGKHQYRMRAKLVYLLITMYSDYTPNFYSYVLQTPTGFTVSVNPDLLLSNGNPYLTLKWNPVDANATNTLIYRQGPGSTPSSLIANLSASVTSYEDTTVSPNKTYYYQIRASKKDETNLRNDQSDFTSLVPKLTLPAPPTNFKANAIDKTIYMSWSHTKDCDGYKIYKWGKSGMLILWSLVTTLSKDTLSYNTTVTDYGTHSFKVTAYNASGDSAQSPTKDVYALKKPTGLAATPLSSTSIQLTFDTLDTNATQVRLSYSTNGIVYSSLGVFNLPVTSIKASSLTPNTQYWFKIAVKRDLNESSYSEPAMAKTLPTGAPPAAPSELNGTALSCNRAELVWNDNSDNEDGFKIERKEGLGSYSEIATVTSNTTTFTDSSVGAEKTYSYRIRAYNSFGNSSYSNEVIVSTPPCGPVPNPPTNLSVTLISVSEAKLKWTDNSDNEQSFILERKAEGETYTVVSTIASNTVETTSTGLLSDTKYYFRIRARNEYGYSNYSNEVSVTTPSETATPDAPTGLTATATSCGSVSLTWTDNSINETSFVVERKLEGESYTIIEGTLPANTNSYTDNTVEEGKKYYYKVKASNANGDSGYSNEVSLTTPPCGFPPNVPSNLTATTLSETEIQLNFTDNSDNEDGFKLERKEPGGSYELIAVLPSNTTSHRDTGLTPNTIYYYRVCAYNSYGASSYSNEANATTKKELTIPVKPTNLFASASSSTEIKLNWTDISDNEDGFKLERKVSGGSFTEIKTLAANSTTYTDTGLTPNTTYYYRLRAYNAKGNSDYSNEASATTMKAAESIIIRLYIDKTTYYVNDELKTMDAAPIIRESRTLLPIRYVAEALGANVDWNATERKVTITFKETTIELWIDKNSAKVNGEYKLIDATNPKVTPIIIPPGRTMLPIRFIAENLGCLVEWNANLREVKVTYPAP